MIACLEGDSQNLLYSFDRDFDKFKINRIEPFEIYTPERKAEFLLNNVVTYEDYVAALEKVRKMGLDPETIPHKIPESP